MMELCRLFTVATLLCICRACTEFRVTAKDSSVVIGRSMEFMFDIESDMYYEPKGYAHTARVPEQCDNKILKGIHTPLTWENRNAVVYLNAIKLPYANADGQNTAGLSFGALYFNEFAKYEDVRKRDCGFAVSHLQLGSYILGQFETVKEVRQAIDNGTFPFVWEHSVEHGGEYVVFQLHYSIQDKSGDSLIIEYSDEGRKTFDNTIGIFTNSPPYDFHLTNLRNYVHVSNFAHKPLYLGEHQTRIDPTGEGNGLLGMPGDYTPPSRFIRTALIKSFVDQAETSEAAVNLAAHILNTVDIPHGLLKHEDNDDADYTEWIVMKDLSTNTLYYRVYNDQTIRSIPLDTLGTQRKMMKVGRALGGFVDTSGELEPVTE